MRKGVLRGVVAVLVAVPVASSPDGASAGTGVERLGAPIVQDYVRLRDAVDANGDGRVSLEESVRFYDVFIESLDADGDDWLTPNEVKEGLGESLKGTALDRTMGDRAVSALRNVSHVFDPFFDVLDVDDDGFISAADAEMFVAEYGGDPFSLIPTVRRPSDWVSGW